MDDKAEKSRAVSLRDFIAPLVLETLPRGELTRRAQELAARSTTFRIPPADKFRGHAAGLDATLRRNGLAALSPNRVRIADRPRRGAGNRRPDERLQSVRTRIVPGPLCCANWPWLTSRTRPPCRPHRSIVSCAPAGSPSANCARQSRRAQEVRSAVANQIWQSDMLFGPWVERAGGARCKVFLQACAR